MKIYINVPKYPPKPVIGSVVIHEVERHQNLNSSVTSSQGLGTVNFIHSSRACTSNQIGYIAIGSRFKSCHLYVITGGLTSASEEIINWYLFVECWILCFSQSWELRSSFPLSFNTDRLYHPQWTNSPVDGASDVLSNLLENSWTQELNGLIA